jgi:hypothetical protein
MESTITTPAPNKFVIFESGGERFRFDFDERHFTIDQSDLDSDLCRIGAIMLEYGQIEAYLRVEVDRKSADLERTYADLDNNIRLNAKAQGEKITENKIKNTVLLNPLFSAKLEELRSSKQNHALIRWAMTALQSKRDCLISFSYRERQLMKAEAYS